MKLISLKEVKLLLDNILITSPLPMCIPLSFLDCFVPFLFIAFCNTMYMSLIEQWAIAHVILLLICYKSLFIRSFNFHMIKQRLW